MRNPETWHAPTLGKWPRHPMKTLTNLWEAPQGQGWQHVPCYKYDAGNKMKNMILRSASNSICCLTFAVEVGDDVPIQKMSGVVIQSASVCYKYWAERTTLLNIMMAYWGISMLPDFEIYIYIFFSSYLLISRFHLKAPYPTDKHFSFESYLPCLINKFCLKASYSVDKQVPFES